MPVSKVIGKTLQGAFPGTITRSGDQLVQARTIAEVIKFGAPVKFDATNNQWLNVDAGDAETVVMGVAVRSIKQSLSFADQDSNEYPANSDADVITRGYVAVTIAAGTPALFGTVYVVVTVGDSGLAVGDFVTTAVVGTTGAAVAVANMKYTTLKDSVSGTAEVHILTTRI